jgi:hypothetical protein
MKETSRHLEKRRVPRIPVTFPVTLTWGRKKYPCQASEFSEFGIFLEATGKELVGEDVELALVLAPDKSRLALAGIVAYATDSGIGVRFKNLSPENQAKLKGYVVAHGIGIVRQ